MTTGQCRRTGAAAVERGVVAATPHEPHRHQHNGDDHQHGHDAQHAVGAALTREKLAIVGGDFRLPDGARVVALGAGDLGDEIADGGVAVEANRDRVRPHHCPAEDAARQAPDVVALERFERGHGNLRAGGDVRERHATLLARAPQPLAEGVHARVI